MDKRINILLIDDDEDDVEIFRLALNELGVTYEFSFSDSCDHALKTLRALVPDFIFLDINMPKKNGFECLKEIKQINVIQKVPVVLFSTSIDKTACDKALALGAVTCIEKPEDIFKLIAVLHRIVVQHCYTEK